MNIKKKFLEKKHLQSDDLIAVLVDRVTEKESILHEITKKGSFGLPEIEGVGSLEFLAAWELHVTEIEEHLDDDHTEFLGKALERYLEFLGNAIARSTAELR